MAEYRVWTGTPSSMGGKVDKRGHLMPLATGSLTTVRNALKKHLEAMKKQAHTFDRNAEVAVIQVAEDINSLHDASLRVGEDRSWEWHHISLTSKIRIERTS